MGKTSRFVAALAAVAMLSGCGAAVREPDIELQGVELGSIGLRGGTLLANIRVDNPNRFSLRADDLRYELFLRGSGAADTSWVEFAQGTYDEEITVGGGETAIIAVPVEFSLTDLGGAAMSVIRTGRFDYRVRGTVDVRTPLGRREIPFRKTGTYLATGIR